MTSISVVEIVVKLLNIDKLLVFSIVLYFSIFITWLLTIVITAVYFMNVLCKVQTRVQPLANKKIDGERSKL